MNHSIVPPRTGLCARCSIVFWLIGALGVLAVTPLSAATIHGTVHGPDGPVPDAIVIARHSDGTEIETSSEADGQYAMEVPSGFYARIYAEPPDSGSALVGEWIESIDVSQDTEVRLFLVPEVTLAGTVQLPPDFQGSYDMAFVGLERLNIPWDPRDRTEREFEIDLPAGVYSILVTPSCKEGEPPPENLLNLCNTAFYLGHVAVDASAGSVEDIIVPIAEYRSPVHDFAPPDTRLISVGPANVRGVATVTGEAGAMVGPSRVRVVNMQTQLIADGVSYEDGSFSIPAFAPPGSYLAIVQDPLGLEDAFAVQSVVRVPPADEPDGGYAALLRQDNRQIMVDGLYNPVRSLGAVSRPQVRFTGILENRKWAAGESIELGGEFRIYFRDAEHVEFPGLPETLFLQVILEQLFDASGAQSMTNPQAAGSYLTTTGYPILSGGWMDGASGSADFIELSRIELDSEIQADTDGFSGNWSASLEIPESLPEGTYGLSFLGFVDLDPVEKHFEDVFTRGITNRLVSQNGIATTITVGSPSSPRLGWVLGVNEFSDGTRGIVANEDRGSFDVSGQIAHNGQPFVLPRFDPIRRAGKSYRFEPDLPLMGAANDGFMPPPRVPLAFPSGSLSVHVQKPDGSNHDLGSAPFRQLVTQGVSALHGAGPHGKTGTSNIVRLYTGLTTLDDRFQYQFDQYGPHTISMTGSIKDVLGNSYEGGGSYEVHVAQPLDLETGVFANTPFEVGDAFSPTVIVQPGVAADVKVTLTIWPESDVNRKIEKVFAGKANRFGYFHTEENPHVLAEHGEYRVDIEASWWDQDGVYWFGAMSWGSVIETPNSPLIAHGARGMHETARDESLQWFFEDDLGFEDESTHMFFPFSNGDIMWMLDHTDPRANSSASGIVTVQDTQGDFADMVKERSQLPSNWEAATNPAFSESDMDLRAQIGEIPLFSSNPTGPAALYLDDPRTHDAYFYSGAGRPGVRVREFAGNQFSANRYWRFNDAYYYQAGNGINGDLANDFKFLFGGAVYRAPDIDFHYYGAYGSLWVAIPNDSEPNTRIFPPFQGNGGGPSGGPIMTLLGEDIDLFFHPTGVRPGSILEVGDVASFAGQIAPTLGTEVSIQVTAPSGSQFQFSGKSNKVGYFYQPGEDFLVDEAGVWTARVVATFRGQTSAGQVTEPFPQGGVLGAENNSFEFYVVETDSEPLKVVLPAHSWVEPGKSPVDIQTQPTDELGNTRLHYTTVMPGFLMEEGDINDLTYTYDAPELHKDFPNLDLADADSRYGVDTVTLSFLLSGEDGEGNTVYRARQVLLQGEELMAPPQAPTKDQAFAINAGHSGAWYNPATSGQGQLIDIEPESEFIFLAWFAYTEDGSENPNQQHWFTAQGNYSGNQATLPVYETLGGKFDDPAEVTSTPVGTIELEFDDCANGQASYAIDSWETTGSFPLTRVIPGTENVCLGLAGADQSDLVENDGRDGAWYDPATPGQGFLIDVRPNAEADDFIFVAWFTYGEGNASGQRWLTAQGPLSGTRADIAVSETTGGSFDDPTAVSSEEIGTMSIQFTDCSSAQLSYDLTAEGRSGAIDIIRVIPGTEALCEELGGIE